MVNPVIIVSFFFMCVYKCEIASSMFYCALWERQWMWQSTDSSYAFSSGLRPCSLHSQCGPASFRCMLCTHRYRHTEHERRYQPNAIIYVYFCMCIKSFSICDCNILEFHAGIWMAKSLATLEWNGNIYKMLPKHFLHIKCALYLEMRPSFHIISSTVCVA